MKFSNMELDTEKNSIQITSRFVDKISDNIIVGDVVATVLKYGIENCFIIGYNHDIGYEFTKNGNNHNTIGGEILRNNFKYWREIYYHGEINVEYKSLYLDILNQADMQIDKYGNDVGYDKRLEDIKSRYGEDSEVYNKCCKIVDKIRR